MTHRHSIAVLLAVTLSCAFAAPALAGTETVPDCVGLSLEQARSLLEQAGFGARVEGVQGRPVGVVVSQEPGGFAQLETGQPVTLRVGAPAPKPGVDMPPAEPTPDDDLPPAGASAAPIEPGADRPPPTQPEPVQPPPMDAPAGAGFSWNGAPVPAGELPRDDGPELPSVLGQGVQQARAALGSWAVNVEQTLAVPNLVGKVVNQWPYAGLRLAHGETVTIVIAVAQRPSNEHGYVPQAQSRDWREGIALIEKSGFVPNPVSVTSSAAERGRIVAQTPQPGSLSIQGSPVRLFIGRGPGAYSASAARVDEPPAAVPAGPTAVEPSPADDLPPAGVGPTPIQPGADEPRIPPQPEPAQPTPDDGLPPAGAGAAPIQPGAEEPTPQPPEPTAPSTMPPAVPPTPEPPPALPAPSLRTPPAGESYPYKYGADFTWTEVRGAGAYELELEEEQPSGAWQQVSITPVNGGARYRPATLERGRYRWRVRAVGSDGSKGRWSEYRRLYMY